MSLKQGRFDQEICNDERKKHKTSKQATEEERNIENDKKGKGTENEQGKNKR